MRERGLKSIDLGERLCTYWSLPVRERGLKCNPEAVSKYITKVAPRAGAWIEIVGGWGLAPRSASLPVRERGLKYISKTKTFDNIKSLPVRERGLKYKTENDGIIRIRRSLPVRERGLKSRQR